jgi:hypothetical protein
LLNESMCESMRLTDLMHLMSASVSGALEIVNHYREETLDLSNQPLDSVNSAALLKTVPKAAQPAQAKKGRRKSF